MSSQPMPDFQREYLEIRRLDHLQTYPDFTKLEQKLLSMGGDMIVPRREPDQAEILSRGRLWSGDDLRVIKGTLHNCHGNVDELWISNPDRYRIATGWALSEDGLWRQHSWLVDGRTLIETTITRKRYFGFVFTPLEARVRIMPHGINLKR